MRRSIFLFCAAALVLAPPLFSQAPLVPGNPDTAARYQAIHAGSSGDTVTIQQPASPSLVVQFELAYISCTATGTVTLSQNGTAATSTTLATKALNRSPSPSQAKAWSASNVSGGTTLNVYTVPAGAPGLTLDLSKFYLDINSGTAANLTLTVSSGCTPSQVMIQWTEH